MSEDHRIADLLDSIERDKTAYRFNKLKAEEIINNIWKKYLEIIKLMGNGDKSKIQ